MRLRETSWLLPDFSVRRMAASENLELACLQFEDHGTCDTRNPVAAGPMSTKWLTFAV